LAQAAGQHSARRAEQGAGGRQNEPAEFAELWRPSGREPLVRGPAGVLLEEGRVSPDQLRAALKRQKEDPHLTVLEAMVQIGAVDETTVLRAIATYFNVPFLPLSPKDVDPAVFKLLDSDFIKRKGVIPVRREGRKVLVGISDPADIFLVDEVKRRIQEPVQLAVTPAADILAAAEELSGANISGVDEIIEGISEGDVEVVERKDEEVTDLEKIAGESPVIRYVNFLVFNAVQQGASDIHIEPGEDKLRIRYRIDGILFEQPAPPLQMHAAIISRVKIMGNLDIAERRLPQDGRIRAMIHGRHVDLRVSTLPTAHGEKCVIRILDNRSILIGLEKLGMNGEMLSAFRRQIEAPHGVVIVTGPTGSGKTTTLYSALRVMDGVTLNISTVEDPVEYMLDFANQVHVRESIGLTFSAALRSLLRQDPDVIMIGEVRDEETARIAIQAALTGHLVLTTLHTNDAPSSITRLVNIGIEPYLIAAAVNGVIAQRLVRRICEHCKTAETSPREGDQQYLARHNASFDKLYRGTGCEKCHQTGYSGRLGLYEMLEMTDDLRDVVTSNPSLMDLRRACRKAGMHGLYEDGLAKVAAGLTTVEEIARVTEA
jgi:type IV pilus assembly protein PilB